MSVNDSVMLLLLLGGYAFVFAFAPFDRRVERRKLTKSKFFGGARGSAVVVDLVTRAVPGAIGDPRLRLAVSQAGRDKCCAKIVKPDL